MMSGQVKSFGATTTELKKIQPKLKRANQSLSKLKESGEQGFMDLPYDKQTPRLVNKEAKKVQTRFKNLIVVGIGGSDLGARAIWQALKIDSDGVNLYFAGGNTDPETLSVLMNSIDLKKTAINVVSKSGSTIETMSAFFILQEALIKKVGQKNHKDHIWATTDINGGVLEQIAKEEGYTLIPHPLNVSGRFAVLSTVGLFPAACAGINISGLQKGARTIEEERKKLGVRCSAAKFAALHYLAYEKRQQRINVLMPYADSLREFSLWYRQLWAESLGKIKGRRNIGPTPVAALGATDQHSQLQLYTDGPADKVFTFIIPKSYRSDLVIPKKYAKISKISYFLGQKMSKIIQAEQKGTEKALTKVKQPNGTIEIPKISPESLGALFQFYETATAFMGELLGVNTYNQPGVQVSKDLTKRILRKK